MRRLFLLALTLGLTLAGLEGRAQNQNPNIRDLKEALEFLKSDKSTDRAFALATMGLMKDDARSASREIVVGFFDSSPDVRQAAGLALMNVNAPLYKPVVALTTGTDYDAKVLAIKDLASLGKDAAATVPALVNFLKDAKPAERLDILKTVTAIAPNDKALAPLLTQLALKDPDATVRAAALKELPSVADASSQLNVALNALNGAQTPATKMEAINVVAALGKSNEDAAKVLKGYLTDGSPQVREAAKKALAKLQGKK